MDPGTPYVIAVRDGKKPEEKITVRISPFELGANLGIGRVQKLMDYSARKR
jgi:hypothetical protein